MHTEKLHITKSKRFYPNLRVLLLISIIIYGLAIFQDYVFSRIRVTGFYWTDTMLYNIYWLLFIPFIFIGNFVHTKFQTKTQARKVLYAFISAGIFSMVQMFVFTSIFIIASTLIFPVPHRFSTILKHVVSNQLHITVIIYLFSPFVLDYLKSRKQVKKQLPITNTITVKNGTRRIKIDISTILLIKADKPYTMVYANGQKFLHDESLKKLESVLDTETFFRVHRSFIINKNHITELKSRKNGDYDGTLSNGESVRLSRHYRQNWDTLLNH